MSAVPEGFERFDIRSPFIDLIGPLYRRKDTEQTQGCEVFGLRIEPRHCNYLKIAHGGLLATFADIVVSRAASEAKGTPPFAVTVSLNVDFLGTANEGQWIEGRASIGRIGGSLAFVSCEVRTEDTLVVRASGVMKFVNPRGF